MRGKLLNPSNHKYISSLYVKVSAHPEYPVVDGSGQVCANKCLCGHDMTPENSYKRPSGRVECRKCEALSRKVRRHSSGESKSYRSPSLRKAATQAFHTLRSLPSSGSLDQAARESLKASLEALGAALGWPTEVTR